MQMRVKDEAAGKRVRCPKCTTSLRVLGHDALDESSDAASSVPNRTIARTKVVGGILALLLVWPVFPLLVMMAAQVFSVMALVVSGAIFVPLVILAWWSVELGTGAQVFLMVLTGILPGYVLVKSCEAIQEGVKELDVS
jgi:hypothetical protein